MVKYTNFGKIYKFDIIKYTNLFKTNNLMKLNDLTFISPASGNVVTRITIANVYDSLKLQLSNAILQNINKDSFKQIDALSVELKSLGNKVCLT